MVNLRGQAALDYLSSAWRVEGTLEIAQDGRINLHQGDNHHHMGTFATKWDDTPDIGVDWGEVDGSVVLKSFELTNLKGLPDRANRVDIERAPPLTTLKDLTVKLGSLVLTKTSISDFTTMPAMSSDLKDVIIRTPLTSLNGLERLPPCLLDLWAPPSLPLLKLIAWHGSVIIRDEANFNSNFNARLTDLISKWQDKCQSGNRNAALMGAQRELISLGLGAHARW